MQTIKKKAYGAKPNQEQEIMTMAHEVSNFIAANRKVISIVAAVLAGVLLLTAGVLFKRSFDEQKAGPLFEAAYSLYSPRSGSNPDFEKALEQFRNLHKQYPSSMSGRLAALYAANCLAALGRNNEAVEGYETFARENGSDKLLAGLAYQRLGYLFESVGKQTEAIKSFEQSDQMIGPGMATMELARLYEASGNSAEAQKKYKIVADKLSGSPWALEATGKVQNIQQEPAAAKAQNPAEKTSK
jgi:tetratricopeptide (TPR) repeat protein